VGTTLLPLCRAGEARGTVVVIDVLRAFTTAALALDRGAEAIVLVADVDEALRLRERWPGSLAMGEVDGARPDGFDLSNSPAEIAAADVAGRRLIHRTTAGTRGAFAAAAGARTLHAAAFVCAAATVAALAALDPDHVTFVITGRHGDLDGDDDRACAEFLAARLAGRAPDPDPFLERVRRSSAGRRFATDDDGPYHPADLAWALRLDHVPLALPVRREEGLLVIPAAEGVPARG
jgi:2-phosphosulfolactate phosphatase